MEVLDLEKTNALLNLINNEPCIVELSLCAKDSRVAKYQLLINRRKSAGLKYFNDSETVTEYQMIWMIFIKTLTNTIQMENEKY